MEVSIRKMEDREEEYGLLLEWLNNPEVMEYYSTRPKTLQAVKDKYRPRVLNNKTFFTLIIESDKNPVGYIQYYPVEDEEEYCLSQFKEVMEPFSKPYAIDIFIGAEGGIGKGIGTKSIKLTIDKIFQDTNCDVILIDPNALNRRAVRCYEKAGFKTIGIMKEHDLHKGKYTDSVLMGIFKY